MDVSLKPSYLKGSVTLPSSKSYVHRYLIGAFLSHKKCSFSYVTFSNDIKETISVLTSMGAIFSIDGDTITLEEVKPVENVELTFLESGTTLRLILPIALYLFKDIKVNISNRLYQRGISLYESLYEILEKEEDENFKKLHILMKKPCNSYVLSGSISSQFISGMLYLLPLLEGPVSLTITDAITSKNYIDITLDVLSKFGIKFTQKDNVFVSESRQEYQPLSCPIEADYSSAAFIDAFNYLGDEIEITNLNEDSLQGDKVYQEYFAALSESFQVIDISNCIDLGPVLFAFAALSHGGEFLGVNRLKIKESDRLSAMVSELEKFYVQCEIYDDKLIVKKLSVLRLTDEEIEIETYNDHRIAMAMSLFMIYFPIKIKHYEVVNKSFPNYFEILKSIGGDVSYE